MHKSFGVLELFSLLPLIEWGFVIPSSPHQEPSQICRYKSKKFNLTNITSVRQKNSGMVGLAQPNINVWPKMSTNRQLWTYVHVSRQQLQVVLLWWSPVVQLEVLRAVVAIVIDAGGRRFPGHVYAHGHRKRVPQSVDDGVQTNGLPPQYCRVADWQQCRLLVLLPLVLLFPVSPGVVGDLWRTKSTRLLSKRCIYVLWSLMGKHKTNRSKQVLKTVFNIGIDRL